MGFLSTLFGGGIPDPTRDWVPSTPDLPFPEFDLMARKFGSLEFDRSSLAEAAFLGRPRGFKFRPNGTNDLRYLDRGFSVSFELDRLAEVDMTFGLYKNQYLNEAWTGYCGNAVIWGAVEGKGALYLNANTTREEIERHLGTPKSVEDDEEDEMSMYYIIRGDWCLDFDFRKDTGTVVSLALYWAH